MGWLTFAFAMIKVNNYAFSVHVLGKQNPETNRQVDAT